MNRRVGQMGDLTRARKMERWASFSHHLLAFLLSVIIAIALWSWWEQRDIPTISAISMEGMRIVGDDHVCPGDVLIVAYSLHIRGTGVLDKDVTVWHGSPPNVVVYSSSQRVVSTQTITYSMVDAWVVPRSFMDPGTGVPGGLPPGPYHRSMGFSFRGGYTISDVGSVDFMIREDCTLRE